MNYKVLYRKYRPDNFNNIIGQEAVVQILKNSIMEEKIAHAYIFSGPRGTGKTSMARIFAKAINCLDFQNGVACGKCDNCLSFNNNPDIIEIDAASNNGVDEIRELINNVKIMPTTYRYKVYIIDEVHMLSQSAFNALLLTLEEPPAHVIFILATTNIENVPITILSRCQKFDFKRINKEDILKQLKYICGEENISYDEDALQEIASLSDGGMRDALSILDQLSKISEKITLDLVIKEVGSISNKKIVDLVRFLDDGNVDEVVNGLNEFRNTNLNYKVVIKKLIEELAKKAVDSLKNGSKHLEYDDYKKIIIELNDVINKINISVDPYTLIEIILLGYIRKNKVTEKINEPVKEIPKKEVDTLKVISEKIKVNTNNEIKNINNEFVNIRVNNCFAGASKDNLNLTKNNWQDFKNSLDDVVLKGIVSDTIPVAASTSYAILETTIPHQDEELNEKIEVIESNYNNKYNTSIKFVFLDEENWNKRKEEYIQNLKNGYKYEIIKEEKKEFVKKSDLEDIASNIFSKEKIEIE